MDRWTSGGNEVLECRSVRMETYAFTGGERLGRDVDYSPPSSAEAGNDWSCTSECQWHE